MSSATWGETEENLLIQEERAHNHCVPNTAVCGEIRAAGRIIIAQRDALAAIAERLGARFDTQVMAWSSPYTLEGYAESGSSKKSHGEMMLRQAGVEKVYLL